MTSGKSLPFSTSVSPFNHRIEINPFSPRKWVLPGSLGAQVFLEFMISKKKLLIFMALGRIKPQSQKVLFRAGEETLAG